MKLYCLSCISYLSEVYSIKFCLRGKSDDVGFDLLLQVNSLVSQAKQEKKALNSTATKIINYGIAIWFFALFSSHNFILDAFGPNFRARCSLYLSRYIKWGYIIIIPLVELKTISFANLSFQFWSKNTAKRCAILNFLLLTRLVFTFHYPEYCLSSSWVRHLHGQIARFVCMHVVATTKSDTAVVILQSWFLLLGLCNHCTSDLD